MNAANVFTAKADNQSRSHCHQICDMERILCQSGIKLNPLLTLIFDCGRARCHPGITAHRSNENQFLGTVTMGYRVPRQQNSTRFSGEYDRCRPDTSHHIIGRPAFILAICIIGLFAIMVSLTNPGELPRDIAGIYQETETSQADAEGWNVSKAAFTSEIRPFSPDSYELNDYGDREPIDVIMRDALKP